MLYDLPELAGHGKGDILPIAAFGQDLTLLSYPLICILLAAGITEASVTAKRYHLGVRALRIRAFMFGITQYVCATGKYATKVVDNRRAEAFFATSAIYESRPGLLLGQQLLHGIKCLD